MAVGSGDFAGKANEDAPVAGVAASLGLLKVPNKLGVV